MKEISERASEEESLFQGRRTCNRRHVCGADWNNKSKIVMWKIGRRCSVFFLYQCERKRLTARECLRCTTNSGLKQHSHRQILLPTTSLYAHSMIFNLSLMACSLQQTLSLCLFLAAGTLWVFITAETDCGPLQQLHPCSGVHRDEGSEPLLPFFPACFLCLGVKWFWQRDMYICV